MCNEVPIEKLSNQTLDCDYISQLDEAILDIYISMVPEYLDDLEQAYLQKDSASIKFNFHKLASATGALGFIKLSTLFSDANLEDIASADLQCLMEEVESKTRETICLLKDWQLATRSAE